MTTIAFSFTRGRTLNKLTNISPNCSFFSCLFSVYRQFSRIGNIWINAQHQKRKIWKYHVLENNEIRYFFIARYISENCEVNLKGKYNNDLCFYAYIDIPCGFLGDLLSIISYRKLIKKFQAKALIPGQAALRQRQANVYKLCEELGLLPCLKAHCQGSRKISLLCGGLLAFPWSAEGLDSIRSLDTSGL